MINWMLLEYLYSRDVRLLQFEVTFTIFNSAAIIIIIMLYYSNLINTVAV